MSDEKEKFKVEDSLSLDIGHGPEKEKEAKIPNWFQRWIGIPLMKLIGVIK